MFGKFHSGSRHTVDLRGCFLAALGKGDALNGDAELPKKNKAQLVKRLKDTVKGKEELVILMHDTDTKMNTVGALPEIIEHLMDQGYEFKSLE